MLKIGQRWERINYDIKAVIEITGDISEIQIFIQPRD